MSKPFRVPEATLARLESAARECVEEGGRCRDFPTCRELLALVKEVREGRSPAAGGGEGSTPSPRGGGRS